LDALEKGTLTPVKQDNENSTYAGMLRKEMGRVNFALSACEIERLIRGLNPWPSAYTSFHGKKIKLFAAEVIDEKEYDRSVIKKKNGEVVAVGKDRILIKCGKGILAVTELQPEGKKRMSTAAYLLGYKVEEGEIFGVD
jgi:methionyl-tRNA formyltransferase